MLIWLSKYMALFILSFIVMFMVYVFMGIGQRFVFVYRKESGGKRKTWIFLLLFFLTFFLGFFIIKISFLDGLKKLGRILIYIPN